MRKFSLALSAVFALIFGVAHSMEGEFDRSAEVDKYVGLMNNTSDTGTLAVVAKEIAVSGISDPRLAAAVNERLLSNYKSLSGARVDDTYGVFMTRALASFGIAQYADTLKIVGSKGSNSKMRAAAHEALPTIEWNAKKNKLMASRQYHRDGDDPTVSRVMNLLMSNDYEFKHYAAERMNWEKILDARLMAAIAPQVQHYVDGGYKGLSVKDDDTIANFIKLLGYSKDAQYRPVLQSVIDSKNASAGAKRHAKYAIGKLF